MEAYAKVLLIAIPAFLGLVILEFLYGWVVKNQTLRSLDTISSLSSGITNTIKNVLGLTVVVIGYSWLIEHFQVVQIEGTLLIYVLSFIAIDFAGYSMHRLSHYMNFFWNYHVIHHSSEEFNLPCALRQSVSNALSIYAIFLIPAALLGLPPTVIAVISPIHLFLQFWYHTKHLPKLGILEYIIVTPSAHRVHHAINEQYLDKNLSHIFIFWDRLFGTYQEELDDVPCVYGTKKPANTWNPIIINFQHLWSLIKDAWRANSYWDKCRVWFMPTGWRPTDVNERYPIQIIDDPGSQIKYDVKATFQLHVWSWIQFVVTLLLMLHMLLELADLGLANLYLYGSFLFLSIFSYTTLMDGKKWAIWIEIIKSIFGLAIIFQYGSWFNLDELISMGTYIFGGYQIISVFGVAWFVKTEVEKKSIPPTPELVIG
ncbi:MAG: alkylglycerol monooxygenase [Bacteroidia bacterium]|jgi:alkylglycerol monooxygenase